MKRKMFSLLVLSFVLLPLLAVQAQTTQGQIAVTGLLPSAPPPPAPACLPPAPATADLTFFIIDGGSTVLYGPDNQPAVPVDADCRFFAALGAGTGGDVPASILQANTSLFVRFDDTATGVTLGILPINSSGYAHFALGVPDNTVTTTNIQDGAVTSAKIAAGSVDSSKIVDGSIGTSQVDSTQVQRRVIGSCDVGNAIRVINDTGTVTCEPTGGGGGIGGSGTANSIPKFTAATTVGDSAITEVGGNVGIGTTSPLAKLHVNGDAFITGVSLGTFGAEISSAGELDVDSGSFPNFIRGGRFKVAPNGNVGIGTESPLAKLHVRGASPVRILGDVSTLSGAESVDFMARNTPFGTDMGGMRVQRDPATGNVNTLLLAAASGSPVSEKMRISGNGNVGIGTITPTEKLEVAGKIRIGGGISSNGGGFKHARVAFGLEPAGTITCSHVAWATPFPDANYTVTATVGDLFATARISTLYISDIAAGTFGLCVANQFGEARTVTIHLIAVHD